MNPVSLSALIDGASSKLANGDYEGAVKMYTALIQLKPENPQFYSGRAEANFWLGHYAITIRDCNVAIQLGLSSDRIYTMRGVAKKNLADYEGAVQDYSMAIKIKPSHAHHYANRAYAKLKQAKYEEALTDFTQSINLVKYEKDNAFARSGACIAKKQLGLELEAKKDYEKISSLICEEMMDYFVRGEAHQLFGNLRAAKKDYRKALELNPNFPHAKKALAELKKIKELKKLKEEGKESVKKAFQELINQDKDLQDDDLGDLNIAFQQLKFPPKVNIELNPKNENIGNWNLDFQQPKLPAAVNAAPNFKNENNKPAVNLPDVPQQLKKDISIVYAEALYNYQKNAPEELTFSKGDKIKILSKEGIWWKGELNGKTGNIPSNYVKIIGENVKPLPAIPLEEILVAPGKPKPVEDSPIPDGSLKINFSIKFSELTLVKKLGEGSYGEVYEGKWKFNPVAIKKLKLTNYPGDALAELDKEAKVMGVVRSDYLVQLKGMCLQPPNICLVMELMTGGTLYDFLRNQKQGLPVDVMYNLARDIGAGLFDLHDQRILHRDIKSLNILLDGNGRAKLCDFGLSKVKLTTTMAIKPQEKAVGTHRWMAPELLSLTPKYSTKSDIYAFAIVLWEIVTRKLPYQDIPNSSDVTKKVKNAERPDIPSITPKRFAQLIRSCWSQNPAERPDMENVLKILESCRSEVSSNSLLAQQKKENSWYLPEHIIESASDSAEENGFAVIPAGADDISKVLSFYQRYPAPGMDLKRVEVIFNPAQNLVFTGRLKLMNDRGTAFSPGWSSEQHSGWRKKINDLCLKMSNPFADSIYPNTKILPMWHGSDDVVLESLFRAGYASLGKTDAGFFGRGIYTTDAAEYAYRVYSKGGSRPLILNWVAFYSLYPVVDGDMSKLQGKGNYENYDGNFVPVVPKTQDPDEVNYYPAKPDQKHKYIELVVFEAAQCLPRYLVELQPTLPKTPVGLGGNQHGLFNKKNNAITYINLYAAACYVYENYLSKPYTDETNRMDWDYRYQDKIVERPNHGLAHALRKVFYVPKIIECYIEYKGLYGKDKIELRRSVHEIQLALLFYVVGRENETDGSNNLTLYTKFRRQSINAFEQYVKEAGIALGKEKLTSYKEAMYGNKSHESAIMTIAHLLDLMRCLELDVFESIYKTRIEPHIGTLNCKILLEYVEVCLQKTGSRIYGSENQRGYDGPRFVKASLSVKECMLAIREASQHDIKPVFAA
ncbi:MAG: protein kinase [Proteobacteria bacterium]|nr:protein kinase [Pseudomonadota bacterium]